MLNLFLVHFLTFGGVNVWAESLSDLQSAANANTAKSSIENIDVEQVSEDGGSRGGTGGDELYLFLLERQELIRKGAIKPDQASDTTPSDQT